MVHNITQSLGISVYFIYLFICYYQVVKREVCGGLCPFELKQVRGCNQYCQNGGTLAQTRCKCSPQYGGQCCEKGLWFNLLSCLFKSVLKLHDKKRESLFNLGFP